MEASCKSSTFESISLDVSSLKCFVHEMNIFMQSLQGERMSMHVLDLGGGGVYIRAFGTLVLGPFGS